MLLFRSEEHVQRWYEGRLPLGATLTVEQQWRLARIWYGDRASASWRRRTPQEAQEVFAQVGLTGAFWRLVPDD